MKDIYDKNKAAFSFFNKMKSPIKRLKNKYRYQVLMRIVENDEKLRSAIFEGSLKYKNDKALVTVEENPSNLS